MVNRDIKSFNQTINLHFNNLEILRQAFIHRSYLNEVKEELESNERFEFLGDSILSFIVSTYLFKLRVSDAEGDLTNLRSYIVKTKSLAEAAQNLHLGDYLLLSKGEETSGGRTNPQLLANTFEALIGAIFLDKGLDAAKDFTQKHLLPLFAGEILSGPPKDAKSQLQEEVQLRYKQSPFYKVLKTYGPDHAKKFLVGVMAEGKIVGQGEGGSKQEAEEEAASQALKQLKITKG